MGARRFYASPNNPSLTCLALLIDYFRAIQHLSQIQNILFKYSSPLDFQNSTLSPWANSFAFFLLFILEFFLFFLHLPFSFFFLLLVLFPPQHTFFHPHNRNSMLFFFKIFYSFFWHMILQLQLFFPHIYSTKSNAKSTLAQKTVYTDNLKNEKPAITVKHEVIHNS